MYFQSWLSWTVIVYFPILKQMQYRMSIKAFATYFQTGFVFQFQNILSITAKKNSVSTSLSVLFYGPNPTSVEMPKYGNVMLKKYNAMIFFALHFPFNINYQNIKPH